MSDIAEAKGRQELYTKQAPQILKALREMALLESVESSNRIEGVTVARVACVPGAGQHPAKRSLRGRNSGLPQRLAAHSCRGRGLARHASILARNAPHHPRRWRRCWPMEDGRQRHHRIPAWPGPEGKKGEKEDAALSETNTIAQRAASPFFPGRLVLTSSSVVSP
jgi:hypothetical protein